MKKKEIQRLVTSLREQLNNPNQDKPSVRKLMQEARVMIIGANKTKNLEKQERELLKKIISLKKKQSDPLDNNLNQINT
jgi:hypothetical protein